LPPSAFDMLARLQVDYPMLFRLTGSANQRSTHSGVLEFTAEEGCVYIPHWMMQNLLLEEGSLITVTNVSLPKATFVKLQPQSTDFLEISNPRAVLEHALRNYSCVTVHDIIQIPYNGKNYHFELKDVQPGPAACIIETDCQVDFDAPVGYVEPERPDISSKRSSACPSPETATTSSSTGVGGAGFMDSASNEEDSQQRPFRGIRIVDGEIVRPDDTSSNAMSMVPSDLLASRTGATGVQRNAAIPESAPESAYWAVAAGEGARLDGKTPAALRDKTGQELDVRQLRAEAAAARMQQQTTINGSASLRQQPAVVSKRKPRVGSKYARLKSGSAAFHGSAHQMQDDT
jgi:ubiquitin fusion degradation protein 1